MKTNVADFGMRVQEGVGSPQVGPASFVTQGGPELGQAGQKIGAEAAQAEAQDAQPAYSETHRQRLEAEAEARRAEREAVLEARTVEREAKRAESMTIHARAQNALAEQHDQIALGIQNGTISKDAAPKLWADASTKIVDEHVKLVDKANSELVRAALAGNVGSFGRSINQEVVQRGRQDIGAQLLAYREEMERFGLKDMDAAKRQYFTALDAQGPMAGMTPAQVQKDKQAFAEAVTFNAANQRLNGSMNNLRALQGFMKALPQMQDLDPAKKNILEGKVMGMITRLENKAIAAENRRLTELNSTWTWINKQVEQGLPVPAADLDAAVRASKGTPFEKFGQSVLADQKFMAEWLRKPPSEMQAETLAFDARLRKEGGRPEEWANLQRMAKLTESTQKLLSNSPLQYAVERGGAQIEPLDITKPDSWGANLKNRAAVLVAQRQQVGGSMGALLPQEAAVVAGIMQSGTPEQKKSYLEQIRRGLGDDNVFRATVQQVAKDSPVTALAAVISTKEAPLTTGRIFKESYQPGDTSARLLRGESLLNPTKGQKGEDGKTKGFPMPAGADEKAMRTRFSDALGEVFSSAPDAFDVQYQAARAYYATIMSDKGDFSGTLDAKAWGQAISATTPAGNFNGKPVLMPWGMDPGTFKDRVAVALPQAMKAAGLPSEVAQASGRFTLQNLTGTSYLVRQGTEYVTGPKGRVVISIPETPGSMRDANGRAVAEQVPR